MSQSYQIPISAAWSQVPPDQRRPPIFVPDTHGHYQKVLDLLEILQIKHLLGSHRLVFLGDFIDRGPDVRNLIELMIRLRAKDHVCIAGNHDLMMRAMLTPGPHLPRWAERWRKAYACDKTLKAYGTSLADVPEDPFAIPAFLQRHLPPEHRAFFMTLPLFWEEGCFIAVHAGIEPVRMLPDKAGDLIKGIQVRSWADQRFELLLMMNRPELLFADMGPRQSFLRELADARWEDAMPEGKCIVSGHWHREVAYFSHSRALIHMGVDYEGPLAAWIPDQKLLLAAKQEIQLHLPHVA